MKNRKMIFALSLLSFVLFSSFAQAGTTTNKYVKYRYSSTWHTASLSYWITMYNPADTLCDADEKKIYWIAPDPLLNLNGIMCDVTMNDEDDLYDYYYSWYWELDYPGDPVWSSAVDLRSTAPDGDGRYYGSMEDSDLENNPSDWDYSPGDFATLMWDICYRYTSGGTTYERRYSVLDCES